MLTKHIAHVLCGMSLVSIFIVVFFFTYAAKIEQQIVEERCTEIVDDLTSVVAQLPQDYKNMISAEISPYLVVPPSLAAEDSIVEAQNKALLKKAAIFVSIFVVITFSIIFIMSRVFGFSFLEILKGNFLVLLFVALTEFVFLTFFAKNYITIDANFVKQKIVQSITNLDTSV